MEVYKLYYFYSKLSMYNESKFALEFREILEGKPIIVSLVICHLIP